MDLLQLFAEALGDAPGVSELDHREAFVRLKVQQAGAPARVVVANAAPGWLQLSTPGILAPGAEVGPDIVDAVFATSADLALASPVLEAGSIWLRAALPVSGPEHAALLRWTVRELVALANAAMEEGFERYAVQPPEDPEARIPTRKQLASWLERGAFSARWHEESSVFAVDVQDSPEPLLLFYSSESWTLWLFQSLHEDDREALSSEETRLMLELAGELRVGRPLHASGRGLRLAAELPAAWMDANRLGAALRAFSHDELLARQSLGLEGGKGA